MKKKTKNLFVPLLACILALILILGASAAFFTDNSISDAIDDAVAGGDNNDNGGNGDDSTDIEACEHKNEYINTVFDANHASSVCPDCGERYLYKIHTSLADNAENWTTLTSSNSGWEVGSLRNDNSEPYTFYPFNSVDTSTGHWLCFDGQAWMNKNCFRFKYLAPYAQPEHFAFGLGLRKNAEGKIPPYDVAVQYTAEFDGVIKIDLINALCNYGDYNEVYDFTIYVGNEPVASVRLGNPNKTLVDGNAWDVDSIAAAIRSVASCDLNSVEVGAGDTVYFVASYVNGTVDQSVYIPSIEYVSFSSLKYCASDCHCDNGTGVCRFCGIAMDSEATELAAETSTDFSSTDLVYLPDAFKHPIL